MGQQKRVIISIEKPLISLYPVYRNHEGPTEAFKMARCSEAKPKAAEHILITRQRGKEPIKMSDPKPISQSEQLKQLANTCLYILQRGHFRGEDSHHVELIKAWMKELRDNVAKQVELEAKKAVEEANKPVEAVSEAK